LSGQTFQARFLVPSRGKEQTKSFAAAVRAVKRTAYAGGSVAGKSGALLH